MGRLIDADALIVRLRNESVIPFSIRLLKDEHRWFIKLEDMIKTQPTAYDVERVVAELEKQLLVVEIEDEHIVPESDVDEYFELDVVPMVDAREIVRKGGV